MPDKIDQEEHPSQDETVMMTADKAPNGAPLLYQLAVHGSFATIISGAFLWQLWNTPNAQSIQNHASTLTEKLIDRTIAGQERLLDKAEKLADKQTKNNDDLRDMLRIQSREDAVRMERLEENLTDMIKEAKLHHANAKADRNAMQKSMNAVADVLKKISEK